MSAVEWRDTGLFDPDGKSIQFGIRLVDPNDPSPEDGEHCRDCGQTYGDVIWWASPDIWELVSGNLDGGPGLFCPSCFSRRALDLGLLLRWVPEIMEDA